MVSEERVRKLAEILLQGGEPLITPNTLAVEYAKHIRSIMPRLVEKQLLPLLSQLLTAAKNVRPGFGPLHTEHITLWTTRRRDGHYVRKYVHVTIEGPELLVKSFKFLVAYSLGYTRRPLASLTIAYTTLRELLARVRGGSVYSGAGLLRRLRVLLNSDEWRPPTIIDAGVRRTAKGIANLLMDKLGAVA